MFFDHKPCRRLKKKISLIAPPFIKKPGVSPQKPDPWLREKQKPVVRKTERPLSNGKLGEKSYQSLEHKKKEQVEQQSWISELTQEDYDNARAFDLEKLKKEWEAVATAMTGGNGVYFAALNSGHLELDEKNYLITYSVANSLQKEKIQEKKRDILKALKIRLKNKLIDLKVVVDQKQEKVKPVPYTNKEKFMYLSQKNPALKLLKDKLDLDYDL